MISSHDINHPDSFIRPSFSRRDKLRRLCWNISWAVLCKWTPNGLHKWRVFIISLFGGKIGEQNFIYPDCKIWAPWLLETGKVVTIGPGVEVYNPGGVIMGHHTIISQNAYLCGATHDYNHLDFTYIKKQIITEPYVWICARAIVLPGVHCGEGSVLAAGAVISCSLKPWTVYAGNPAVPVKTRVNFLEK